MSGFSLNPPQMFKQESRSRYAEALMKQRPKEIRTAGQLGLELGAEYLRQSAAKDDNAKQTAAQEALIKGLTAEPWADPDIARRGEGGDLPALNKPVAPAGGLAGALTALRGQEGNPYATDAAQQLAFMKFAQDQTRAKEAADAAAAREQYQMRRGHKLEDAETLAGIEARHRAPPKPTPPKTVNVAGNVHTLNADGTLGPALGQKDRFIPVPGVGVLDTQTNQYVGNQQPQQPAPPTGPTLQAPADPTQSLPPAKQGQAKADELKAANKSLDGMRESLQASRQLATIAKRFGEISKEQETGGFLRRLPGASTVEGAFDPEISEMSALQDRVTPLMRQGLPGAASDRDVAMFRGATFGTDKRPETNRNIMLGFEVAAQTADDRLAFMEQYVSQFSTLRGAEEKWKSYLEANPIFDPNSDPKTPMINNRRKSWREHFQVAQPLDDEALSGSGIKVRTIK